MLSEPGRSRGWLGVSKTSARIANSSYRSDAKQTSTGDGCCLNFLLSVGGNWSSACVNWALRDPLKVSQHPYMVHGDLVVTIPNPHRSTVSVNLLQRILRQAGVSRKEWLGES